MSDPARHAQRPLRMISASRPKKQNVWLGFTLVSQSISCCHAGKCILVFSKDLLTKYIVFCSSNLSRYPDLPTLPHWAEAFRISRPASDLPHFHKIFRFQLKSDQHVFPVWTAMQLTWLSTSYHDHSSLSCPLISRGSVKTETLPALCNKNNKPIDLIHLWCGWQLTLSGKGRAYMVSRENAPHQTLCLTENVSFPNMHTLQTPGLASFGRPW